MPDALLGKEFDFDSEKLEALRSKLVNIECDAPNNSIYTFNGRINCADGLPTIPLNNEHVVLRGMILNKNTPFIIGCVVYTGEDTKVQMNNAAPVYKSSKLMKKMNWRLLDIFFLMATFILVSGIVGTIQLNSMREESLYLEIKDYIVEVFGKKYTNSFFLILL